MEKKLYITTAIPYVNGTPHIGNAMDYLLADIWTRYKKQNGFEVKFQVGTDEHGNKVAAKAAELGLDPKVYADQGSKNFLNLMNRIGAQYTDFIRTTDPHHIAAVQYIWKVLAPYIYKGQYEGWYCQGCEAFVTEKEAAENNGVCPDHQKPYEHVKEWNYYFKTSEFTEKIRQVITDGTTEILPDFRKKEFLELIKDGLTDVSISRPKKTLSWGVPVPGDPDQVMYVWLDALANYITVLGYPDKQAWREYWPADIQVIGKDILRFHAGLWLSMLMALGLELPKRLLVHGHVHVGGVKMSKTIGNVIDPIEIMDNYGTEAFRYFFSRHISAQDDGDFTWETFENAYNGELANDLGNVAQRISGMVMKYQSGVVGEIPSGEHDMTTYHEAMEGLRFNEAIDEVWMMVRSLNQYIEHVKPWEIAKKTEKDPEAANHLNDVLNNAVGSLVQIADLLVPFLPETADKIHQTFKTGSIIQSPSALFPKIYKHTPDPSQKK